MQTKPIPQFSDDQIEEFWSNTVHLENECWSWSGPTRTDGRPFWWPDETNSYTPARVAYTLIHGDIPNNRVVTQVTSCPTRHCVNPDHLEATKWGDAIKRWKRKVSAK